MGSPGWRVRRRPDAIEAEAMALFEAVLAAHGEALKVFAYRLVGSSSEAEDLVQETLLRAWRQPSALDGSKGSVRAWLFSVARNLAIDQWRRQKRTGDAVAPNPRPGGCDDSGASQAGQAGHPAGDLAERVVEQAMVAVALESLSEDHRQVLVHSVWLDQPVARIAEDLGVPPGTVKSRVHYALKALRLALEEMGYLS